MDPNRSACGAAADTAWQRFRMRVVGQAHDPLGPEVLDKVSLMAFLAWVGLGVSALSSSTYGPDEAFRALHGHSYLAVVLIGATVFTIFVKSRTYSRVIEHFPFGGGGYVAAAKLLGAELGLVSGAALLVDYVLAISVSIAAAADASFSFLPPRWQAWKLLAELSAIGLFMILNLRGVKESVTVITPVFLLFIVTHLVLILGTIALYGGKVRQMVHEVSVGFQGGLSTVGTTGMAALLLYAYGRGAGTYTGIEAISNGLQLMREPRVQTARRTMFYTSVSLAVMAGGILLCYLLVEATPIEGRTMNAVLAERLAGGFTWSGLHLGRWFIILTLASETAILAAAAQSSFISGPRVMASMATDSWLPHRFSCLSDRLTVQNGVMMVSVAATITLLYTHGQTTKLVVIYSISVFITFLLSQLAMLRYWFYNRARYSDWWRQLANHLVGLVLCIAILEVNVFSKFRQGGGAALALIAALIGFCLYVRHHYRKAATTLRRLDELMREATPAETSSVMLPRDTDATTAICFVKGYDGLGIQFVLSVPLLFGIQFENFVFAGVGVIGSGSFKGAEEIENLRRHTEAQLSKYVALINHYGYCADYCYALGIDAIDELERLAHKLIQRFPRAVFFVAKLIFEREGFWHKVLHNQVAFGLERRLQLAGLHVVVLAIPGDTTVVRRVLPEQDSSLDLRGYAR
ncbi:MAG: APC family permease [Deltaproteobacteria bacterium]|nr:APC family permease [Deltaproteobacteria bacterium]